MVISICNHKGGVGKTTAAVNLSAALAREGKKTLAIDMDSQRNLSKWFGVFEQRTENTIYNSLRKGGEPLSIRRIEESELRGNLDLVPGHYELRHVEKYVSDISKESILKRAIQSARGVYDFIIIDCPPSLGFLTTNALVASDRYIIALQPEPLPLEGISDLDQRVEEVRRVNKKLSLLGVFITLMQDRNIDLSIVSAIKEHFGEVLFETMIKKSVKLCEAAWEYKSIFAYDPKGKAAISYASFAGEVIERSGIR